MKLNNRGFAISAILYSILIAFMMFLLVALSMFSSSSTIISSANDDLINGDIFEASQVKQSGCVSISTFKKDNEHFWYENSIIVKINHKGSTIYWPRDFNVDVNNMNTSDGATYKNINVKPDNSNIKMNPILTIKNMIDDYELYIQLEDVC